MMLGNSAESACLVSYFALFGDIVFAKYLPISICMHVVGFVVHVDILSRRYVHAVEYSGQVNSGDRKSVV